MRIILRPIKPTKAKPFDYREYEREIKDALQQSGALLVNAFDRVVANWNHKPRFQKRVTVKADAVLVDVYPTGSSAQIWRYVDEGTRGHWVGPVRAKALRFNQYYATHTAPGGVFGGPGKAFGPVRFSKGHYVRGVRARGFTHSLLEGVRPEFIALIRAAIRDAGNG